MGRRILIVKPSSFGDIVHIFPALKLLGEVWQDAEADFVVNPEFSSLLEFSPLPIRKRIIFERRKLGNVISFLPEFIKLIRAVRQEKYDLVIDFQGLFRSGLCTFFARAAEKAGFAAPREKCATFAYSCKIPVAPGHAVEKNVRLVEKLFDLPARPVQIPELPVSQSGSAALPELPERYFVLLPGTRWESKRFPVSLFTEIAAELQKRLPGCAAVVAGSKAEREIASQIGAGAVNLAGMTTLPALFELLRNAEAVIGNDSGPLHAAAALGVPVFGFYGPTLPELTGPWGENSHFLSNHSPCAGCLKRICPLPETLCHRFDAGKTADFIVEKIGGNAL